ncbi:hypothetical protein ABSA28_01132 [Candidatus Hepatincolaceae symbiont of Richtersius coronifer]
MKLLKNEIAETLKFEKQELMRLFICLSGVSETREYNDLECIPELYEASLLYLTNKIGGELDNEEKEIAEKFAKNILKIK